MEPTLHKTSKSRNMKNARYNKQMQKKYEYLYKWFNPKLTIDLRKAIDFLNAELINNSDTPYKALRKFNCGYLNSYRINQGHFYFNVDTNIHRLHTPLTNIKKELRNYITYEGMKLVAVDIKNSQPLISGVLLNENFYTTSISGNENDIKFSYTTISQKITTYFTNNTSSPSHLSSYIMVCKNSEPSGNKGFHTYMNEIQNGTLYQYIQKELEEKTDIRITDRKMLKEIIFTTLFTDNRYLGQEKAKPKRIFKQLFPDVYNVFSKLKQKDKNFLSNLLQSIESKLMLDYVAKRISIEKPDMPIFTIHDSIVCPVGNEQYVANVIKEEIQKAIGMNPQVSFEYWKDDSF